MSQVIQHNFSFLAIYTPLSTFRLSHTQINNKFNFNIIATSTSFFMLTILSSTQIQRGYLIFLILTSSSGFNKTTVYLTKHRQLSSNSHTRWRTGRRQVRRRSACAAMREPSTRGVLYGCLWSEGFLGGSLNYLGIVHFVMSLKITYTDGPIDKSHDLKSI